MAYSELIKNFEKIRAYIREFYVYGFKKRNEYDSKSLRSYDDERRRIESWLGDYMRFTQTTAGKNVFLSVDSRVIHSNPFYKAWKAKSFTDKDITLHFVIFDILYCPEVKKTLSELVQEIDSRLSSSVVFDDSTVRKKLNEYSKEGIICTEKNGKKVLYSRARDTDISGIREIIDFFSETAPCGVIGSFIQDKMAKHESIFSFKHHYITQSVDSDILAELFDAMSEGRYVEFDNFSRNKPVKRVCAVPLKVYISVQNGKQNLIAFQEKAGIINSYRLDYISNIKTGGICAEFDELRNRLKELEDYMWGVNCFMNTDKLEHVEFEVKINEDEQYIVTRLEREKRCGSVEKIDNFHYRYKTDVFDTWEMVPWIRTFISRIVRIEFSNLYVKKRFWEDINKMYQMYGVCGGDKDDI